jgi:hypothetical protein
MVLYVLENIDVSAPDGFKDFGFYLTVCKKGMSYVYFELRGTIMICIPRQEKHACIAIIGEIYFSYNKFRGDMITSGNSLRLPGKAVFVDSGKFPNDLICEYFGARTRDNAQVGWI